MGMGIYEKAMAGLPLDDVYIFDCHGHAGKSYAFNIPGGEPEDMIRTMDFLGVDRVAVSSLTAIYSDPVLGNDITIEMTEKYPGRFFGYVTINPNYPESVIGEIDRCFRLPGIIGLKFHPDTHQTAMDHPNYHMACAVADEKRCPVLIHTWGEGNVMTISSLAGRYQNAVFIMGHSGGPDKSAAEAAVEAINRRPNLYGDLTMSYIYEGALEWFVKEVGAKKILYGTDIPFLDPRPNYGRVALADISDDDKRDILGLNMDRILEQSKNGCNKTTF